MMKSLGFIFSFLVLLTTFILPIAAEEPIQEDSQERSPNWPTTIVFNNAANAAFSEPYILQKKKIMLSLEEQELELKTEYMEKQKQLDLEVAKAKPDKKKVIALAHELFKIQMKVESIRLDAKNKINAIDQKLMKDLLEKVDSWVISANENESTKYEALLKDLKK